MSHPNDDIDIEYQPEPDRLYAHNRRQLSAMLDGELSPDQARFMLRRLQHDTELAACWERWQVCGDVLRGRGHALLPADFSKRVAEAIAAPADATAPAPVAAPHRPHRLLRWGGGALAASVALVALFMARQMPDAQAPALVETTGAARAVPAVVDATPRVPVGVDDGALAVAPQPATPAPVPAQSSDAAALLAAAAPAVIAVAEVPRRAAQRGSSRSQAQRAALRRADGVGGPARTAVAAAPQRMVPAAAAPAVVIPDGSLPVLAGMPAAGTDAGGDALFGAPAAAARPWPRAVLPGLSRSQPFAAGYGLPQQEEAFAPFQPRLDGARAALPAQAAPRPGARPGSAQQAADQAAADQPPGG